MKPQKPHIVPGYVRHFFFVLGLLSAIAFRAIIILQHLEPAWVKVGWYTGTLGYVFFFLYRFEIAKKRKKAIAEFNLVEKIKANACLTDDDREVVLYLLSSLRSSPEDLNYAIIFILSIAAIAADLFLTALK